MTNSRERSMGLGRSRSLSIECDLEDLTDREAVDPCESREEALAE